MFVCPCGWVCRKGYGVAKVRKKAEPAADSGLLGGCLFVCKQVVDVFVDGKKPLLALFDDCLCLFELFCQVVNTDFVVFDFPYDIFEALHGGFVGDGFLFGHVLGSC